MWHRSDPQAARGNARSSGMNGRCADIRALSRSIPPLSSCADLFRASTFSSAAKEHVDGRDKHGHDDTGRRESERTGVRCPWRSHPDRKRLRSAELSGRTPPTRKSRKTQLSRQIPSSTARPSECGRNGRPLGRRVRSDYSRKKQNRALTARADGASPVLGRRPRSPRGCRRRPRPLSPWPGTPSRSGPRCPRARGRAYRGRR